MKIKFKTNQWWQQVWLLGYLLCLRTESKISSRVFVGIIKIFIQLCSSSHLCQFIIHSSLLCWGNYMVFVQQKQESSKFYQLNLLIPAHLRVDFIASHRYKGTCRHMVWLHSYRNFCLLTANNWNCTTHQKLYQTTVLIIRSSLQDQNKGHQIQQSFFPNNNREYYIRPFNKDLIKIKK